MTSVHYHVEKRRARQSQMEEMRAIEVFKSMAISVSVIVFTALLAWMHHMTELRLFLLKKKSRAKNVEIDSLFKACTEPVVILDIFGQPETKIDENTESTPQNMDETS